MISVVLLAVSWLLLLIMTLVHKLVQIYLILWLNCNFMLSFSSLIASSQTYWLLQKYAQIPCGVLTWESVKHEIFDVVGQWCITKLEPFSPDGVTPLILNTSWELFTQPLHLISKKKKRAPLKQYILFRDNCVKLYNQHSAMIWMGVVIVIHWEGGDAETKRGFGVSNRCSCWGGSDRIWTSTKPQTTHTHIAPSMRCNREKSFKAVHLTV